jgi:diguanylate cyclase
MLSRLRLRRREGQDALATGADAIGEEVLAFLHAHGLETTPPYYALVHAALSDRTSIAAHSIDDAMRADGRLAPEAAERILDRLCPPLDTAAADAAGERLRHQTLHLADLAAAAAAATGQFGRDLSAGLGALSDDGAAVARLLATMIERTRDTEQRLAVAVREIDQLRDEVAEARNDAMRDALTGLLNRRGVIERVRAETGDRPRTLALCDLDGFKAVNDRHGHEVGDRVLRMFAAALEEGCAAQLVGRWGGEEFIIVLDEADPDAAAALLDTVREAVAMRRPRVRETGEPLGAITFSAGVARITQDGFDAALRDADGLLYAAKVAGRNRVLTAVAAARAA